MDGNIDEDGEIMLEPNEIGGPVLATRKKGLRSGEEDDD